jgi:hypothetical protein
MTEWDHGAHDGPDHDPGVEPDWDAASSEPAAHLGEPSGLSDDPYGSGAEPGPDPHTPDAPEPAGLPAEEPADWSVHADSEPGSWDQPHGGQFDPDPGDPSDGTDPAGWTADAAADPFPPALDVDIEPGDGGPWVDPDLLGGPERWTGSGPELAAVDPPAALLPDLAAADGDPDAGWDALRDSDDPAVRALTLHWNP